jgi:hypothetical protein
MLKYNKIYNNNLPIIGRSVLDWKRRVALTYYISDRIYVGISKISIVKNYEHVLIWLNYEGFKWKYYFFVGHL